MKKAPKKAKHPVDKCVNKGDMENQTPAFSPSHPGAAALGGGLACPGRPEAHEGFLDGLVRGNAGWLRGWFRGRVRDPELVDDLCQETFLRALRGLPRLRDPSRFSTWLYRTAQNLLRDHFRRNKRRKGKVVLSDDLEQEDTGLSPQEALSQKEETEQLLASIESLPERYREPLLLRHARDLSYSEIGSVLGISESSVRVRVFRARQMLRAKCNV